MELDDGEDDGREDDGPLFAFLPPEDRLWRHPSEMNDSPTVPNRLVDAGRGGTATAVRPVVRVWTLALAAGMAGAVLASGFFMATGITDRRTTVVEPVSTPGTLAVAARSVVSDASTDWPSVVKHLAASIVAVRVSHASSTEMGSGVLYGVGRDESYVITARDLVGSSGHVMITFESGVSQPAEVVGTDPLTGIALLSTSGAHQSVPTFGSVSDVEVAEQVLAVGTQVSSASSIASDAVSGVDEDVTTSAGGGDTMDGMLALSGVAAPATSDGGALVDGAGAVVGIDTDITSTDPAASDVGYAVPIDTAEHVAKELLRGNRPTHPWLGVDNATDLGLAPARQFGVPGGAQVGGVTADSPASRIGLQPNDIITSFDGQPVTSSGALVTELARCQPGQTTGLTYYRDGRATSVRVKLAEQPAGL